MTLLDDSTATLVVVPDDPALRGGRVAVSARHGLAGPATLAARGRRGMSTVGVRVVADETVPFGTVVVPDPIAARLGHAPGVPWRLTVRPAAPIAELTLEASGEEPTETLWQAVERAPDLLGQCLWTAGDVGSAVVDLGSRRFRVQAVDDGSVPGLREVVATTRVSLFLPAARVGLDVVVLADCSRSMVVDDLPAAGRRGHRSRLEVLKESLERMLEARLRVAGRESRFALIRFTRHTEQRFPRGEGMIAVDAASPPQLIAEFRRAIAELDIGGGTNIPAALLRAAEVLDRYGKRGNDRLVVLVSDGRPWSPDSAETTGEVVNAVDDPVSLVDHLHKARGIRLQAVGISDDRLYRAWLRRDRSNYDNPALRPDHPLLFRLVDVGGGDPTRIGGVEVLESYFGGLGAGLTRHVGTPKEAAARGPLAASTTALLDTRRRRGSAERCREATSTLRRAVSDLNDYARRLAGRELGSHIPFQATDKTAFVLHGDGLRVPISSEYEFEIVLNRLYLLVVEQGPGRRRREGTTLPAALVEIYACFEPHVSRVNALRQIHFHDKTGNSGSDQKDVEKAVRALRHYVDVVKIESDDAARWEDLRTGLLVDAAEVAERALDVARRLGRGRPPAEAAPDDASHAGPADRVAEYDLRVRN